MIVWFCSEVKMWTFLHLDAITQTLKNIFLYEIIFVCLTVSNKILLNLYMLKWCSGYTVDFHVTQVNCSICIISKNKRWNSFFFFNSDMFTTCIPSYEHGFRFYLECFYLIIRRFVLLVSMPHFSTPSQNYMHVHMYVHMYVWMHVYTYTVRYCNILVLFRVN